MSVPTQKIKCLLVGDVVGKTCLVISYTTNAYPEKTPYFTVGLNHHTKNTVVDGKSVTLTLLDTSGNEHYEGFRATLYRQIDVLLICFSLADPCSFETVCERWHDEVRKYCKETPIILVGTMLDRKDNRSVMSHQGEALAERIGAVKYLECSALTQQGVKEVFEEAIRAVPHSDIQSTEPPKPQENKCSIL